MNDAVKDRPDTASSGPRHRYLAMTGAVIGAFVFAAAFWAGSAWGGRTHTTTAFCSVLGNTMSCGDTPGSGDYIAGSSVPWTGAGSTHMDGRPACLGGRDRVVEVAIGFEEVNSNGMRTKQVVWVDCDSAQPVD